MAKLDLKWNDGDYYGRAEQPAEYLHLAIAMMNVAAFQADYCERTYKRETALDTKPYESVLGKSTHEKKLDKVVSPTQDNVDLNHWLYTCRMYLNFDVSRPYGGGLDAALSRIKVQVLAVPSVWDALHPAFIVQWCVDHIVWLGGNAGCYSLDSDWDHMAVILQTHLFAGEVRRFLES